VFLIDTSGSMEERMDELKKELVALVWEQLHKHRVRYRFRIQNVNFILCV
jgi:hypothetical protein